MDQKSQIGVQAMIINAAMMAALLTFAVIVFFIITTEPVEAGEAPLWTLMALGFVVAAILGSIILPRRNQRRTVQAIVNSELVEDQDAKVGTLENRLATRFLTGMIVATALLESAGFLAVGTYMLDRHWLSMVLVAVVLATMAARFATPGRVATWVADVQREARDISQLTA